jgi:hypothetical protein
MPYTRLIIVPIMRAIDYPPPFVASSSGTTTVGIATPGLGVSAPWGPFGGLYTERDGGGIRFSADFRRPVDNIPAFNEGDAWVQIDLGRIVRVSRFTLTTAGSNNSRPRDFLFLGSNDGENFTVIRTIVDQELETNTEYSYAAGGYFRYYRWNVTKIMSTTSGVSRADIRFLQLYS